MNRLILIALIVVSLSGCVEPTPDVVFVTATSEPTPDATATAYQNAINYSDWFIDIVNRWDDATEIANLTAKQDLGGPISELQAIRREAVLYYVEDDPQLMETHQHMINAMELVIDGWLAFANEGRVNMPDFEWKEAGEEWQLWRDGLKDLGIIIEGW